MIRSRPLVDPSELCILDEKKKKKEKQSPDGLLDENSEKVQNLQSPDEKNMFLMVVRSLSL